MLGPVLAGVQSWLGTSLCQDWTSAKTGPQPRLVPSQVWTPAKTGPQHRLVPSQDWTPAKTGPNIDWSPVGVQSWLGSRLGWGPVLAGDQSWLGSSLGWGPVFQSWLESSLGWGLVSTVCRFGQSYIYCSVSYSGIIILPCAARVDPMIWFRIVQPT